MDVLPIFAKVAGKPVILIGEGPGADAKRLLLQRAGATVVEEEGNAQIAIVAVEDTSDAVTAVKRLRARNILVNAVDRPELCDFTIPAIIDRSPVVIAIGTGGVSAGLAAALRQRLEILLPANLGLLAEALNAARATLRKRLPDGIERRRAIGAALAQGGAIDALEDSAAGVADWAQAADAPEARVERICLMSEDPDDLTLRQARWLAAADRVAHSPRVPAAILDRARADAVRIVGDAPAGLPGLTVTLEMAA